MNARQIANLAYVLLTEDLDEDEAAKLDARIYEGALDDVWQEVD